MPGLELPPLVVLTPPLHLLLGTGSGGPNGAVAVDVVDRLETGVGDAEVGRIA